MTNRQYRLRRTVRIAVCIVIAIAVILIIGLVGNMEVANY